jgi:hypothetical protein
MGCGNEAEGHQHSEKVGATAVGTAEASYRRRGNVFLETRKIMSGITEQGRAGRQPARIPGPRDSPDPQPLPWHRICIRARLFRFLLAPMRDTAHAGTLFTWRGSVS